MTSTAEWTPTIIIVDDEPSNVKLLHRLLTSVGYEEVTSTTEPRDVIDLYRKLGPDLLLLDLHMPELDGFTLMVQLRQLMPADDQVPILVLTADTTVGSKHKALTGGATDFLTKPFDADEVLARVRNLLETRFLHLELQRENVSLEERVQERTAALWETVSELERTQKDLRLAQEETIHSLSLAADFRDDETSRHIERMSRYCALIAQEMVSAVGEGETFRLAAKMHDIGKIGIPDSILRKPGRLTPEEFDAIKAHPQIGYDILSGSTSELATTAAAIAWTHHEKLDGSGYPRGLSGEEIPVEGRIAAIADVFDALTTDRIYRKAFSLPEALGIMRDGRDSHFDPSILDLFFDNMDEALRIKESFDDPRA